MKQEVIVPSPGESVSEVFIVSWRKNNGELVQKDEVLVDLETQKATFELQAEVSGRLEILKPEPNTKLTPGELIAFIDTSAALTQDQSAAAPAKEKQNTKFPQTSSASTGLRVQKDDLLKIESAPSLISSQPMTKPSSVSPIVFDYKIDASRGEKKTPATRIRKTIAQNLLAAQHGAAILTTFNEIDMSSLMAFRSQNKESFKQKYGVSLGMLGFFALASVKALKEFPLVNSVFTGEDIIQRDFVDISVAVSTDQGLVVPVIRDVQQMTISDFEKKLAEITEKARNKKLSIPEMTGGTFTISNGGVFGSLWSTPILNMPQSAILGLHKIQDRPVVIDGQIQIRPMMYVALSYDHRIIDGREAVLTLVKIKEAIENINLIVEGGAL